MNATELAKAMIEYEELQRHLDALGEQIKATVLELGKTQTVGNLTASYSGGRKSYDYETAVIECGFVPDGTIAEFTETIVTTKTKWKDICDSLNIEAIPFTKSEPSVTLKVKG